MQGSILGLVSASLLQSRTVCSGLAQPQGCHRWELEKFLSPACTTGQGRNRGPWPQTAQLGEDRGRIAWASPIPLYLDYLAGMVSLLSPAPHQLSGRAGKSGGPQPCTAPPIQFWLGLEGPDPHGMDICSPPSHCLVPLTGSCLYLSSAGPGSSNSSHPPVLAHGISGTSNNQAPQLKGINPMQILWPWGFPTSLSHRDCSSHDPQGSGVFHWAWCTGRGADAPSHSPAPPQ